MARDAVPRIPALTSLRFVAAAVVVLWHSDGYFGIPSGCWAPLQLKQAVSLFFVLSGFILTYSYPRLESGRACARFLLARFARLWPAHVFCLGLGFLLLREPAQLIPLGNVVRGWSSLALNLTMLQSWVPTPSAYFSWNAVSWSISTEFAFYLLFPLLIARLGRTWEVKLTLALALVPGLLWLGWALRLPRFSYTGADMLGLLYFSPLARLFEFVLGMVTALAWQRLQPQLRHGRVRGTAYELAAVALAAFAVFRTPQLVECARACFCLGDMADIWLPNGLVAVPFALLIGVLACDRGGVSRLLTARPLVLLGEISYGLYLIHQLLIRYYAEHREAFTALPGWLVYLGFWATALLAAYLLWACVEVPARKWLVGLWPRPGAAAESRPSEPARRRPWVAAASAGLAGLAVAVQLALPRASARFVDEAEAVRLARGGDRAAHDVPFGDTLVLRGARLRRTHNGMLLELVWESLADQRLDHTLTAQLGDSAGRPVPGGLITRDRAGMPVRAGQCWAERIFFHWWPSTEAARLTLRLRPAPGRPLPAAHGGRPDGEGGVIVLRTG
jgi:peptidoglycan/LPS O-acetylase OafA/YrhL